MGFMGYCSERMGKLLFSLLDGRGLDLLSC